jgi:hypothetical protein
MNWARWWRRQRYALEDFLDDVLPRPSAPAPKPLLPRPKMAPSPVTFSYCGVGNGRAKDTAEIDAEWTASIMRQIASNKYFEIQW